MHFKRLCRPRSRGFVLVITLSLMVLLTVIAVGLLSLSAITLRAAAGVSSRQEARNNARLALVMAIGDLQQAAGPDRRITATADIAAAAKGYSLDAGEEPENSLALDGSLKGLSKVQPGTRYWTGVFTNRDSPTLIYKKTPAAQINRWLVSGIQHSAGSTPSITPANEACIVGSNGTVKDASRAIVLVGTNSVGSGSGSHDQYVAAPLVEVDSGEHSKHRGAFAYWIGDEGVKGRIDMERSNEDSESYASLVAQRRGWETVEGFSDYPPATGDSDRELPRIVTVPTAELLIPSLAQGNPSPRQSVFHSATTESRGLIVDTLNGGTRVDLTAAFSSGLASETPPGAYDNYPVAGGRVIPTTAGSSLRHLTWDHLEEFYRLREDSSGDTLKVRARSSEKTASIAPVITDFRILMGVRLEAAMSGTRPTGKYKVFPCGKIALALANPYSVPLEWDQDLTFEIKNMTPLPNNRPSRIWQLNSTCAYIPRDGTPDRAGTENAVFNQAIFRIKADKLEAGEARAYSNASKVTRPNQTANRAVNVELKPFNEVAAYYIDECVEMETSSEISLPFTMDVRESWQTTLVMLEMNLGRSSGRNSWLRRIEGFELDNGYFSPNQRTFTDSNARRMTRPVALMIYSFQISQPGMNYITLMPRGYELGQRASTLRTFADFNLRASTVQKTIASYNPPPYFMESNDSAALLPFRAPGGESGRLFTRNLAATPMHWGHSAESGSTKTVLFSVPRQFTSLAQLQHADLTNDEFGISIGHQPGNAFGNSYASPFVRRDLIEQRRVDYVLEGSNGQDQAKKIRHNYYDISHILNSCFWDRYFFSTIPANGSTPENPTLVAVPGTEGIDRHDPAQVAAGLMINGSFNINSTDKNAWKVLLGSAKYLGLDSISVQSPEAAFPRSLEQPSPNIIPPTGEDDDSFSGHRRLTDEEIDNLAIEIVRQVRLRGPFVSLSHFVNRALANIRTQQEFTRSGALQFALDESGVNISIDGRHNGFGYISTTEDRVTLREKDRAPRADMDGGDTGGRPQDADPRNPDWARTSRDNNFGAVASIVADRDMLSPNRLKNEQGFRSTGIPGWVTQADVLQVIGPLISARSDTFRIRTCGQARDKAGNVVAIAYCEAIVQRQPFFVDPANPPDDRADSLNATNKTYGRRFDIVSFRWLSPQEI